MTRLLAVLLALAVCLAGIPAGTVAQSADGESVVSADLDVSRTDATIATARGLLDRALTAMRTQVASVTGDAPTAGEEADRLRDEVNSHSDAYAAHLTDLAAEYNASVANDTYVLELEIADSDDETDTVYLEIVGDGDSITNVTASSDQDGRDVDRLRELSATQAREVTDDLVEYRETYVEPGETPSQSYFVQKASTYGDISELTS